MMNDTQDPYELAQQATDLMSEALAQFAQSLKEVLIPALESLVAAYEEYQATPRRHSYPKPHGQWWNR